MTKDRAPAWRSRFENEARDTKVRHCPHRDRDIGSARPEVNRNMPATALGFFLLTTASLAAAGAGPRDEVPAHEWVLYRPANSTFYFKLETGKGSTRELSYGAPGDVPLYADFTGSGKRSPALYRKGVWLVSTRFDSKPDIVINFGGHVDDVPLAADVDGDGRADAVIFRDGEWHVRGTRNTAVTLIFHFGARGDMPLLADFDGDGKIDFAVFRAGHWYVDTNRDGKADLEFTFGGVAGEQAIAGEWTRAGQGVPMLFRAGEWLVSAEHNGAVTAQSLFGAKGDLPLAVSVAK
jgi:hypothetical protein